MLVPIIHSKSLAAFLRTSRDHSSLFFVCMCRKKKGAEKIYDRKSSLWWFSKIHTSALAGMGVSGEQQIVVCEF